MGKHVSCGPTRESINIATAIFRIRYFGLLKARKNLVIGCIKVNLAPPGPGAEMFKSAGEGVNGGDKMFQITDAFVNNAKKQHASACLR